MVEGAELVNLIAGGAGAAGGFAGAFAAIKVHIHYITKRQDRQDAEIARVDEKAALAHRRIDDILRGATHEVV